jgi:hypothetical protein
MLTDDRQANASRLSSTAPPSRRRDGITTEIAASLKAALAALTPVGSSVAAGAMYLSTGSTTKGTATRSNGNVYLTPLYLPRACMLDRIGVEITSPGSSGAVVRLGVWAADPISGLPTTLLLDAGTLDGTLTGFLELTINLNVGPGLIWVGAAGQGAPATGPTLRLHTGALLVNLPGPVATAVMQGTVLGYVTSGVTGAFGAISTYGTTPTPIVVAVRIKV